MSLRMAIGASPGAGSSCRAIEALSRAARHLRSAGSRPRMPIVLLDLGEVTEARLGVLPPPGDTATGVLLWMLPPGPISIRTLYVVAFSAWSLDARHVRCLLPRGSDLGAARRRIAWGLARAGCAAPVEVLSRGTDWKEPAMQALLVQILRSALCAGGD